MTTERALIGYWIASVALPIGAALCVPKGFQEFPSTGTVTLFLVTVRTFFLILITYKLLRHPKLKDFLHR